MKHSFSRSRSSQRAGFTLVELLVVMGIIAILAGVLFPAATSAINAAKRARANTMANQIQTSVIAYNTEYGVYPAPSGQATGTDFTISDASGSASTWGKMIYGLCGNISPYNGSTSAVSGACPNTRAIAFLTLKTSDVDSNNAPKNPIPNSTTNPYFNIAIDFDYDGVLGVSPSAVTSMPNFVTSSTGSITTGGTSSAGVAIWANCNTSTATTSQNPAFYVHTY